MNIPFKSLQRLAWECNHPQKSTQELLTRHFAGCVVSEVFGLTFSREVGGVRGCFGFVVTLVCN